MELTIKEQPLHYLRKRRFDPIYQEQTAEITVPESLPDMDRIVDCWGTVILQEKRCEDGVAQLNGGIQAGVLYVPAGEGEVRTLEAWLPFRIKKNVELAEGCLLSQSFLKSLDARMVNPRKALVRANLGVELTALSPEQLELAAVEDPPEALQQQQNQYSMSLFHSS